MSDENAENKQQQTPDAAKDEEKVVTLSEAQYQELTGKSASLEASLAAKAAELAEARKMLDAQAADIASLKSAGDEAVKAYKRLAVSSNPLFSDDVITGSTISEVDAAMSSVLDMASKVRSRIESEIKTLTVPAGAPERSGPDLSTLSPREKIKLGLEAEKK